MSARRISLSDLADRQEVTDAPHSEAADEPEEPAATQDLSTRHLPGAEAVTAPTRLRPNRQKQVAPVALTEASHMRYDEYERKETPLREDQYGRLTTISRQLNKHRKGRGERITENTLIRVAIDLLLTRKTSSPA